MKADPFKYNETVRATISAFAEAVGAKSDLLALQGRRAELYAKAFATRAGLSDKAEVQALTTAALLCNLGMLAVPEYILSKRGPLTAGEFEKFKEHVTVGADILKGIEWPYPIDSVFRYQGEHWDGSGYPNGLRGVAIPRGARMLAIVRRFVELTSDRADTQKLTPDQAAANLKREAGSTFDPDLVATFTSLLADGHLREAIRA